MYVDPIESFAADAKQVVAFAKEEARNFQHESARTEHLLLGLLRLHNSGAVTVLHGLGVDLASVRNAVEFILDTVMTW